MHVQATLLQDTFELTQVLEATQDGPWNDPDMSPLAQERLSRVARVEFHRVTRLAQELVQVHDMHATEWAPIDRYADVSPMWQNVHYMLREHFGVENGMALAVVRELAHA